MITGAGGSIGSEISKELSKISNIKLILVDNNELNLFNVHKEIKIKKNNNITFHLLNILDTKKMTRLFDENKIDIVIHAISMLGYLKINR